MSGFFSIDTINIIKEAFYKAIGTGLYFEIFIFSLIVICILFKRKILKDSINKEKHVRVILVLVVYSIIIMFLNFNPFFANIYSKILGDDVYWRVYWMLPMGIVMAYCFTELIFTFKERYKKFIIVLFSCFLIIVCGKFVYNSNNFIEVSNNYKIPNHILEIIQDISMDNEKYKKIAGPFEFSIYTRQIDGNIVVRDSWRYTTDYPKESIVWKIQNGKTKEIVNQAKEEKCNYIILNNGIEYEENIEEYGYKFLAKNEVYTIYKYPLNFGWEITQYGSNAGDQLMCYTIEGDNHGLVIVDGGYFDDEETIGILKEKILKNDNIVNSWIITHFDTDHAGAYFRIKEELEDLVVEKLYVPDSPSIEDCKEKIDFYTEEDWDMYKKCMNIEANEKQYVYTGDEVDDIIGLKFKVLYSYEDWIKQKTRNLVNNSSIVFKLYGNEESILFCGDVQEKSIGNYLIEKYNKDLKSEYLQVGHHGNNWLPDEFYELVKPKVAFFPATEGIMLNVNNVEWYTTRKVNKIARRIWS